MATKKGKKKDTKKAKAAAKKRGRVAAPKKAASRRAAAAGSRKGPARNAPARKAPARKAGARKASARPASTRAGARPGARRAADLRTPAPKKPSRSSAAAKAPRKPVRRYDRPGHLDPQYAADLRSQSGHEDYDPRAFIERPRSATDDLAEERGEEVVEKATTGEDEAEDMLDQVVPEEQGGPFVETNAAQEFAHDTDASNP